MLAAIFFARVFAVTVGPTSPIAFPRMFSKATGKGEWINMFYYTGSPNHGDQNEFMCEGDREKCEPPPAIREWVGIHEAGVQTIMESIHDFKTFEETARMLEDQPQRFFNTQP